MDTSPIHPPGEAADDFLYTLSQGDYGLPRDAEMHATAHGDHGDGVSTTVRTAEHRGHRIRIETTYKVTVDGRPLRGPLEVGADGSVHYHGLPQYVVPSAVDMVRLAIDYFGTEPPAEDELGAGEHGGGGHH